MSPSAFFHTLPRCGPDLLVLLAVCLLFLWHRRREGLRRLVLYAVFSVYMAGVLLVTVMPILGMAAPRHAYTPMILTLFRDLRAGYSGAVWQLVLNVLMTVPLGFLWPVLRRGRGGFFAAVAAAFLLSLAIELVQPLLPTCRTSDITDILCNTVGGAVGYWLHLPFRNVLRRYYGE